MTLDFRCTHLKSAIANISRIEYMRFSKKNHLLAVILFISNTLLLNFLINKLFDGVLDLVSAIKVNLEIQALFAFFVMGFVYVSSKILYKKLHSVIGVLITISIVLCLSLVDIRVLNVFFLVVFHLFVSLFSRAFLNPTSNI